MHAHVHIRAHMHACTCINAFTQACIHTFTYACMPTHARSENRNRWESILQLILGIYTWIKQLPFLNCLFNKNFNRMSEYLLWNFVVVLSSSRYNPSGLTGTSSENCHRCVVCFSGISPAHTLLYSSRRGEEAAGLEVCSASLAAAAITRWSFPMTKTLL